MRVEPADFYRSLIKVLTMYSQDVAEHWKLKAGTYTKFMRSKVFPAVGDDLGLKTYSEKDYYTLDCVYYTEEDVEHLPWGTYAKRIAVALEHENRLDEKTYIEMNKLQIINAPLKVLITYAGKERLIEKFLPEYRKIIEGADIFQDTATKRRQLVVFGENPNVWHGFVYDPSQPNGFSRLSSRAGEGADRS